VPADSSTREARPYSIIESEDRRDPVFFLLTRSADSGETTMSRRKIQRPVFGLALIVWFAGSQGHTQEARLKPAGADARGEKALFDGKTLEGWKKTDFLNAGEVKVEQGVIAMSAGRSMTGITSTRGDLPRTNYELSYQAMRTEGQDFFAAATFPVGSSYITLVNGGWSGSVTGLSSLDGMDASENDTSHSMRYKDKTWYRFRVRVTDKMIRCWIDDKELVAVNHQNRRVSTRIETRRCQPLGFATWETAGALRQIIIRPLTPGEIVETDKFEE
jgi:hypothetical protein